MLLRLVRTYLQPYAAPLAAVVATAEELTPL